MFQMITHGHVSDNYINVVYISFCILDNSFSIGYEVYRQKIALLVSPLIPVQAKEYCLAVYYKQSGNIIFTVILLEENYTVNLANGSLLDKYVIRLGSNLKTKV